MKLVETKNWTLNRKTGGLALKAMREQRGVTQDELSAASGVPKTLISRLETGGTEKPDIGMLSKLYGAFGLSPSRAAQDYGVYVEHAPLDDPRMSEVGAAIRSLDKEQQNELIRWLWNLTRAFLDQRRPEQRETERIAQ